MQHPQPEQITAAASITSGVSTATVAGFQLSEIGVIVGTVFTVLTFFMSLYFHIKKDRRERDVFENLQLSRMRNESRERALREAHKDDPDQT